ncbi:DHH family phosphoesterase, partial [Desulfofundulus sp.]|uniref:DHH family phosphoesterase n=1 Tax=Desulfofundulus sp. TaxID=2282750 RepID=UPI003C7893E5
MQDPIWRLNRANFEPEELAALGLGRLLSRVLAGRFPSAKEAYEFAVACRTTVPSAIPELAGTAALVIAHARRGKVLVSGDYDADGICATAMLVLWLEQLGAAVDWYLPDRAAGYGFGREAVEKAARVGATLVIAVDSGTNNAETCRLAREKGIDVAVVDHHEPLYGRPPVNCFVNPRYDRGRMEFTDYCTAGLVYKLIEEMALRLKRPVPPELIVLAAVATVGDVMPLVHENRYLVKQGLMLWPVVDLPGIAALREACGL